MHRPTPLGGAVPGADQVFGRGRAKHRAERSSAWHRGEANRIARLRAIKSSGYSSGSKQAQAVQLRRKLANCARHARRNDDNTHHQKQARALPAWNDSLSALPASQAERAAVGEQPTAHAKPWQKPRSRVASEVAKARAQAKAAMLKANQHQHAGRGKVASRGASEDDAAAAAEKVRDLGNNHFVIRFNGMDDPHADDGTHTGAQLHPECASGSGKCQLLCQAPSVVVATLQWAQRTKVSM